MVTVLDSRLRRSPRRCSLGRTINGHSAGDMTLRALIVLEAGATRKPLRIKAVLESSTAFAEISIAFNKNPFRGGVYASATRSATDVKFKNDPPYPPASNGK